MWLRTTSVNKTVYHEASSLAQNCFDLTTATPEDVSSFLGRSAATTQTASDMSVSTFRNSTI